MKERQITQCYTSPEAEVIETQVQMVICQSGGINDMDVVPGSEW